MFSDSLMTQAAQLLHQLRTQGLTLTTAESCTGGLIAALLTEIPGSSDVFTHGWVSYANAAKTEMLGVDAALIAEHGAVSEAVARAMAEGARAASGASLAVAVTGIAGPGGGSAQKPVGTVHLAVASATETRHAQHLFSGNRAHVRMQAVAEALRMVEKCL